MRGGGFGEAAEVEEEDDVEGDKEREGCVVDGLDGDGCPGEEENEHKNDGHVNGSVLGDQEGDTGSDERAEETRDAAAHGVGPLRLEDQDACHGGPVAVANVKVAIDGGAEEKRDGEAHGIGDRVVRRVKLLGEAGEELVDALAEARGEGRAGTFGGGASDEVKACENEHLESSAGEDHGGASDGVVEALREITRDDDVDGALLADPTGGRAQVGEQRVVDGGNDGEEEDCPSPLGTEAAGQGCRGDAEGEEPHAEQGGGEGFVEDGEADRVGGGSGDGSGGGMAGDFADEEREGDGDGGARAVGGGAPGPGEECRVCRYGEEVLHGFPG